MNGRNVGVIIEVNGDLSIVGMYNNTNDSTYIWKGNLLAGPKIGSFLTIKQNDIKIIASVISEKILDDKNEIGNKLFDNTYSSESIKRIITIKTKGVLENGKFVLTNKKVPMIGNQVSVTTNDELNRIYGIFNEETIEIGTSILEDYPIKVSIANIFASHIGIFGNTGSGKSNTLHKLYLELFKTKFYENIRDKSQFFVIDFNGEYCSDNIFGIHKEDMNIIKIDTKKQSSPDKIHIMNDYFFDSDILSLLFDARPATQVPFIKSTLRKYQEIKNNSEKFADLEIGLFKKLLIDVKHVSKDSYEQWIEVSTDLCPESLYIRELKDIYSKDFYNNPVAYLPGTNISLIKDNQLSDEGTQYLHINDIKNELNVNFSALSEFRKLAFFFHFQEIYETAWQKTNPKYLGTLIKRIDVSISSLEKVIVLDENVDDKYKMFNIISLLNANTDVKRLVPMLFSKMIYNRHKEKNEENNIKRTTHLIIDEAHNILNHSNVKVGDDWKDYRLSIFEEIIKEGRKFGFYLTLASQRPADISPTIMSQLHNYIIHRLVNENDINMLRNTMTTLDPNTLSRISSLGQGEAIITGTSINVPLLVKIYKENITKPKSDDLNLIELWSK